MFVLTKDGHMIHVAEDIYSSHLIPEQIPKWRDKVRKLSTIEMNGLPTEIILAVKKPYMITTNVDVSDGLANGAIGYLRMIEFHGNKLPPSDIPSAQLIPLISIINEEQQEFQTTEGTQRKSNAYG